MIDLMVSLAIVSILIALMFPAISMVRESTRKVICASNLRQSGLGMSLFTQERNNRLPDSIFLPPAPRAQATAVGSYDRMDTVLLPVDEFPERRGDRWDGLGILYNQGYVSAPNIFYCPSHHGSFTFIDAQDSWMTPRKAPEIIVNYLYRGIGPNGERVMYNIDPNAALASDTMRSYYDLNHDSGFNVLQAGLAVTWFDDVGDEIANDILLRGEEDGNKSTSVQNAWGRLDDIPNADD